MIADTRLPFAVDNKLLNVPIWDVMPESFSLIIFTRLVKLFKDIYFIVIPLPQERLTDNRRELNYIYFLMGGGETISVITIPQDCHV